MDELTNKEQLEILSEAIQDQMNDREFGSSLRIEDDHHILWAGNPDSKIAVVSMYPDRSELSFAIKDDIHNKYVCTGPEGSKFRVAAKQAGFGADDFFYTNIIPFFPMAGGKLTEDSINRLIWIFDGVINIVKPKIIITLGFDPFNIVRGGNIEWLHFMEILKSKQLIYPLDNMEYVIVPIRSNEYNEKKGFYSILKTLFTNPLDNLKKPTLNNKLRALLYSFWFKR